MKIVFWQNVLSIHQEALLVELARQVEVWLIYEEELYENRKTMGWDVPKFEGVKLISVEDIEGNINSLLQNINNDYHIFSGINAYLKISKYFNIFYKENPSQIISLLEKPGGLSSKLKNNLRKLKYRFYAKKYNKLKYLLTPGGKEYLEDIGFPKDKIIQFGYYGPDLSVINKRIQNKIIQFIYVGSLSKLKNVHLVIEALKLFEHEEWHLNIIGDGEERDTLIKLVEDLNLSSHVTFLGQKNNNEVQQRLASSDCLLLASLYDGWGFVVNEALANGCAVICSDACGVSSVLSDCKVGYVFHSNDMKSLQKSIEMYLSESANIQNIENAMFFFKNTLSGKSGANKLLKLLDDNGNEQK